MVFFNGTEQTFVGIWFCAVGLNGINRAFGFFGDALRLGWADDLLETELKRGKTLQDTVKVMLRLKFGDFCEMATKGVAKRFFNTIFKHRGIETESATTDHA